MQTIIIKCLNFVIILCTLFLHVSRQSYASRATMNKGPIPELFILDFDGTITQNDTSNVILKSAVAVQNEKGRNMTRVWADILIKYSYDYHTHIHSYMPREDWRIDVEQEIQFYRSFKEVEEQSFNRISDSGIFAGINETKWEELGSQAVENGEVVLREGFENFVGRVNKAKAMWSVISVSFSRAFIKGVLSSSAGPMSSISITANQPNKDGILKGPWGVVMTNSDQKMAAVMDLMTTREGPFHGRLVYIGDSGTDIECLLAGDVIGVIMSEDAQGSLVRKMRRIGYMTLHIREYKYALPKTVYWARNFVEIVQSPLLS